MAGGRTEQPIAARLLAHGSQVDWERAYLTHAPELLRYLRRLARDDNSAEDLMQTTFERAVRAGRTPANSELRPWLYRIATNLAVDHLRRRRRFAFLPFSGDEVDGRFALDADADAVRLALRRVRPEEAAALLLRLHEGFSRAETAELLGVSERTVKERLARGRQSFARAYRGEAGEG